MGPSTGRILAGVIVLAIGVGFLLDAANVVDFGDVISDWWPLIIVAAGVIQLVTRSGRPGGAILLIGVGLALLAWTLGYLPRNVWGYLWPIAIILIGLAILFGRGNANASWNVETKGPVTSTTESDFERSVTFAGAETRVDSQEFRGARLSATFGGLKLDLRGARLAPEGATVVATATFGGIEILVPREWRVRVDGSGFAGGFGSNLPTPTDLAGPVLTVKGSATFGGVEVKT